MLALEPLLGQGRSESRYHWNWPVSADQSACDLGFTAVAGSAGQTASVAQDCFAAVAVLGAGSLAADWGFVVAAG